MVAAATAMMLAQPASARATKCGVSLATAAPKPVAGAGAGNSDRAPTAVDPLLAASAPAAVAAVAAAIAITTLRQLAHAFTVVALVPRYPACRRAPTDPGQATVANAPALQHWS